MEWKPLNESSTGETGSTDNQWVGKTWVPLGDSITDPNAYEASYTKYHVFVSQKLGMASVTPRGYSGATIAKASNGNDLVSKIDIIPNADLITSFGGTNDYGTGKVAGDINSTDINTIYGALHHICQRMITNHPSSKYALFTPLRRSDIWGASTGVIKLGRAPNSTTGLTLVNIADIVLEVGAYYSIPTLDLLRKSGIEPSFTQHKDLYMPDGIHPNTAGHERMSNVIVEFLKTI